MAEEKKYEELRDISNEFLGFEVTKVTNDPVKGQKLIFSLGSLSEDHNVTAKIGILTIGDGGRKKRVLWFVSRP